MDDLAGLSDGRIEELPPRHGDVAEPALAYLERDLFSDTSTGAAPSIDGALRFFEGAGTRGALELVGDEILSFFRSGSQAGRIGSVDPTLVLWLAPLGSRTWSTM